MDIGEPVREYDGEIDEDVRRLEREPARELEPAQPEPELVPAGVEDGLTHVEGG